MQKTNIFLFFSLLFCNLIIAQGMHITYQQVFENTNVSLDKRYDLFLTDSVSVYIESTSKAAKKTIKDFEDQSTSLIDTGKKKDKNLYYNNREAFIFIESFFGEALAIQEENEILNHNWKYIDSTKTIGTFTCKLATTEFRGRNYSVWYTEDIPTDFGPWKLKNLPGLALQVSEDKNNFKLNALQIENIPADKTQEIAALITKVNQEIHNKKKLYDIKSLQEFKDEKNQAILSRIQQQLPRGSKMPSLDEDCKDCGDELEIY